MVSSPPTFSNDAKKLLVCTGNSVSVFSSSTALLITELEGHADLVTSVIVVPASTPASKILSFCWTASLDGTIRYWDFSVAELMKTINIKLPIYAMLIPKFYGHSLEENDKVPDLYAYVSVRVPNKVDGAQKYMLGQIRKCNLTKSRLVGANTVAETEKPERMVISSSGMYFGLCDKRKLRIWNIPATDADRVVIKNIKLHHTKNLTTLAFHPTERNVAAGDVTGRILIWRGFGGRSFSGGGKLMNGVSKDNDERPGVRGDGDAESCTTWHWHSSEVKLLFFSSDGAYLYSGGNEGVLVAWQLETGKKKFLPRIGSPLLFFICSPDPSLSSISCLNNQIHLLKMPSMEILKSIAGIKLPCSVPENGKSSNSGFVFDGSSALVAVRAANYSIQFYSLFDDREISEVQVCERNHQPGDEITMVVSLVAFSLDGSLMGTVDARLPEEGIGGLVSLKFWTCGSHKKDFSLSTVIYEPHSDAGISAIAFHPTLLMAVSSSYGGDFKVWVRHDSGRHEDQRLQRNGWTCHAVGSYKRKPMTAAAFSSDGSVLAVAAETVITLWDPLKNTLVAIIGNSVEPIVSLSFVGKSDCLVSVSQGSSPQVSVWSMSKLSLSWSYKLIVEAVACTEDDASFAVLAILPKLSTNSKEETLQNESGVILLFNVGDPAPVATWFVTKALGGGIAFLRSNPALLEEKTSDENSALSLLVYMNSDHEYAIFDPYGKQGCERRIVRHQSILGFEETGNFGYSSVYGELPEFNPKIGQTPSSQTFAPSERPWETIFSGSSHALPPLTKLCSAFLESLLEKRTTVVE